MPSVRDIACAATRKREAQRLYDSGLSWGQVGEALGVSAGTAHRWATSGGWHGSQPYPGAVETVPWHRRKIGLGVERCPKNFVR